MDYGAAMLTNVETTMHTAGLIPCVAYTAGLARVVPLFFYNADAFESGFVRKHPDDPVKRPFMELLVSALSPVFAFSDVLQDEGKYKRRPETELLARQRRINDSRGWQCLRCCQRDCRYCRQNPLA